MTPEDELLAALPHLLWAVPLAFGFLWALAAALIEEMERWGK